MCIFEFEIKNKNSSVHCSFRLFNVNYYQINEKHQPLNVFQTEMKKQLRTKNDASVFLIMSIC